MFDLGKIWGWFKKNFTSKDVLFILVLIALYFATRLINLGKFPIFTDEGIYINWAKIAWHDANWRFISLTDGKQPLHIWGMIPFLKLFPQDPLFAGRLFSVLTGFKAMVGIYALLFYLFGKKAAYWGAVFYIFTPFFLFYDRMALIDSGVNTGFIWLFFFSILLARTMRLDVALLMGFIGGFSLLAKSSSKMFVALSALAPVLTYENFKRSTKRIVDYEILFVIVLFLSLLIYNVQRLSPFLHFVSEKNKTFVMPLNEFIKTPFLMVFSNIKLIPLYASWEAAFVLILMGIVGLVMLWKKDFRLTLYILLWIVLPFLAIAFFAKVVFPRYLIFFGTLFLVAASYFISQLKNKGVVVAIAALFVLSVAYFDYTIMLSQKNIPFPDVDRGQYIEGISSGFGLPEIMDFARQKDQEKPVILLAEGNFGVVGDMLNASLRPGDNITVKGYWPLNKEQAFENVKYVGPNYVYIVFSHRTDFPSDWPTKFVAKYEKPGGKSAFYLFEVVTRK